MALRDVSFDVHRGEFFGIVGRNGTGKSTLLKILASIYRAEAGSIRMAGRVAPFIELGVGFNPELTARENVVLNGVLMGLSRDEAESRVEAVIEFAELEEFADLKLKNYSSGMLVRLAFAVMIQSDADILLIDEVLAVGDAAFQQKCKDVFHEIRGSDRTVVLVTHDMTAVEQYCHRAMLLDQGDIVAIGDPDEVARRYLRLNFAEPRGAGGDEHPVVPEGVEIVLLDAWLESEASGRPTSSRARSSSFTPCSRRRPTIEGPSFGFVITNADGVEIGGFARRLSRTSSGDSIAAGGEVHVRAQARQPLRSRAATRSSAGCTATTRSPSRCSPCRGSWTSSSSAPEHGRAWSTVADRVHAGGRTAGSRMSAAGAASSCATSAARRRSAAAARRFCELLWLMAVTEFKRAYFGTVLGYFWSLLRPLMLFAVLLFVFTQIFRLGSDGPELSGPAAVQHRPLRLLPGVDDRPRSPPSSPRRESSARRSFRAW